MPPVMQKHAVLLALLGFAALPAAFATGVAGGADGHPWAGSWRLDRERSHFIGPAIKIEQSGNVYHFDFGAVAFDVAADGKDHVTVGPRTTSIKQTGPSRWYRVHKANGVEVDHSTLSVADPAGVMTIETVAKGSDGTSHTSTETLRRLSPGTGLAGTWRSDTAGINISERIDITPLPGGRLHWSLPDDGQFFDVTIDGPAVPLQGASSMAGLTMLVERVGSELHWTNFLNGKPWMRGIDRVQSDGRTLEETTWTPSWPGDRQVAMYRCDSGPCAGGDATH